MAGTIAHQEIDYGEPITYGAAVTVRYRVSHVGESSITVQFEATADDEGSPTDVPAEWVERITQFEESPVERE
ncbi:MAG: acyl-CoA thioesterase [Halanaeroarchaeum sp.]